MRKTIINLEYFKNRIIEDNNGCWNWSLSKDNHGYGIIRIWTDSKKKYYSSHRLIYELINGKINNSKLYVCHKCDNPSCCNPEHLFLGTHQDNMDDMVNKGRHWKPFGNKFNAKSIEIDGLKFSGYKEAGRHFGISDNGVRKRFKSKIIRLPNKGTNISY